MSVNSSRGKFFQTTPIKENSDSFFRVLFKILDDHPHHFYMGVPLQDVDIFILDIKLIA